LTAALKEDKIEASGEDIEGAVGGEKADTSMAYGS